MIDILAGIGVIALVIGAGFFVNYMEGIAERRKEDRLEQFYKDEFGDDDDNWWNEQNV
jgi:hypothetical protein|tara:strand:+ start:1803 stop:1976 length:174 start_codon:yes stop_codon:yes gene_type:complete